MNKRQVASELLNIAKSLTAMYATFDAKVLKDGRVVHECEVDEPDWRNMPDEPNSVPWPKGYEVEFPDDCKMTSDIFYNMGNAKDRGAEKGKVMEGSTSWQALESAGVI